MFSIEAHTSPVAIAAREGPRVTGGVDAPGCSEAELSRGQVPPRLPHPPKPQRGKATGQVGSPALPNKFAPASFSPPFVRGAQEACPQFFVSSASSGGSLWSPLGRTAMPR